MKTYKASEMEACKAAWNGATDWCSFRDGWMARAERQLEAALHDRLNSADQRIDDLETALRGERDAEGWYSWTGAGLAKPTGRVHFQLRCGSKNTRNALHLDWSVNGDAFDIVKWKPAQ